MPKENKLTVRGPDGATTAVEGTKVFRVQRDKAKKQDVLVALAKEPKWLLGFKGATGNESLGSLVAKVDGRNVPLTVGYHKVTVDIRDQIARTTIEESFVNHTDAVLEGVFYFPLPQDASISGFGMWIGDELVEADVVEKQRAREIYETILREKRDPGPARMVGRQHLQGPRLPDLRRTARSGSRSPTRRCCRCRQQLSLQLRPAKRAAEAASAARAGDQGDRALDCAACAA